VRFDPYVVTVKQSSIVSLLIFAQPVVW